MKDYNINIIRGHEIRGEQLRLARARSIYAALVRHCYAEDVSCYINNDGDEIIRAKLICLEVPDEPVNDIRSAFEKDSTLSQNITSNLDFTFSGYKVKVEYTFSCHDENEAEAESFSNYCLQNIREGLQEKGYTMEKVTCEAGEMDMAWLDRLETMWFG